MTRCDYLLCITERCYGTCYCLLHLRAHYSDSVTVPPLLDRIAALEEELAGERALNKRLQAAITTNLKTPLRGAAADKAIGAMKDAMALTPERALAEKEELGEHSL